MKVKGEGKMKTLLKNKRTMAGTIAILFGLTILLVGLSQAWFTSSGSELGSTIVMGDLKVIAELEDEEITLAYPGVDYQDLLGAVQLQEGSLDALVKLSFSTEVTIKSDSDGYPLDEDDWYTLNNPDVVKVTFQEDGATNSSGGVLANPFGIWLNNDDLTSYLWAKDSGGDTYVWMGGYDILHFAYTVDTVGADMGNVYKNAVIKVSVNWQAVQSIPDGAIMNEFGIAPPVEASFEFYEDVIITYPDDTTIFSPFVIGIGPELSNAEKLGAIADKLPESALKNVLKRIQATL
jgi:hypothetical protein